MARRGRVGLAAVLVGAGWCLQGCGGETGGMAQVRVVHLAAGLGAVDLLVQGTSVETGVGEMSVGGYVPVRAGQNHRVVAHAESGAGDVSTVATFEAGKQYEVAVFGTGANRAVRVIPFGPAGSFRVVDLAPEFPEVDVTLVLDGTVVASASLRPNSSLIYPMVEPRVLAKLTPVSSTGPLKAIEIGSDLEGKEAIVVEDQGGMAEVRVFDQ